jgi:hypothetical protein
MPESNSQSAKDHLSEKSRADIERKRKQIYHSMSAKEKLQAASDLYYSALHLKQVRLKRLHPDWPEKQVEEEARKWMLYAKT